MPPTTVTWSAETLLQYPDRNNFLQKNFSKFENLWHFNILRKIWFFLYNPEYFIRLICQKWDVLSDTVCPSINAELGALDKCYAEISQALDPEGGLEAEDLTYADYAMITLTANCFAFNRFRGKLTTQIWRTLESILLDTPPTLSFKVQIIKL